MGISRANALILLLLALLAIARCGERFARAPGIDFYQFWGTCKARSWSDAELGSPYRNAGAYAGVLNERFASTADDRLREVTGIRQRLDLTATPLLYALFAGLPETYSGAFGLYHALQIAAFLIAMLLLGKAFGGDSFSVMALALLALCVYEPLASELRVGNVNSFQLLALAFLAGPAGRKSTRASTAIYLSTLVLLTLAKPNLGLVACLLLAQLWRQRGGRVLALAAVPAGAFAAAAVVLSCLYFRSWRVWGDWFGSVFGANHARLVYPVEGGNASTVALAARLLGVNVFPVWFVLAGVLAGSLVAVMVHAPKPRRRAAPALLRSHLPLAAGVVSSLALFPLAWSHYYLVSLVPALWLLYLPGRTRWGPILGGLSIILSSETIPVALAPLGLRSLSAYSLAGSWIPLWAGTLAELDRTLRDS